MDPATQWTFFVPLTLSTWDESQNRPPYISIHADDTTLMAGSQEELKSFFIKLKEDSEKAGLKLNITSLHGKYMGKQWKQ